MSGETSFAKIVFAQAADEVNKFPVNVSEPGAKTIDKYLEEHTLTFKTHAVAFEAKSGEWAECTKAFTVTLPLAATASQLIGVINVPAVAGELVKITTSGGAFIQGDFITIASKTATITLTEQQHVLLISNGTNWHIVAGEPKRESKWTEVAKARAEATEFEVSASRPSTVMAVVKAGAGTGTATFIIAGSTIGALEVGAAPSGRQAFSFPLNPGQKWEWIKGGTAPTVESSYLIQ